MEEKNIPATKEEMIEIIESLRLSAVDLNITADKLEKDLDKYN